MQVEYSYSNFLLSLSPENIMVSVFHLLKPKEEQVPSRNRNVYLYQTKKPHDNKVSK